MRQGLAVIGASMIIGTLLAGCGSAGHAARGPAPSHTSRTASPHPSGSNSPSRTGATGSAASPTSPSGASSTSPAETFNQMIMLNATTGFVWGYFGTAFSIWKTTDGGQQWHRVPVPAAPGRTPVNPMMPVVDFLSTRVGWIAWVDAGGHASTLHVLRTTDSGTHWTPSTQTVPPVVFQPEQIDFLNNQDGWLRALSEVASSQGDPSILQTTDGGGTWTLVSATAGYVPNTHATPHALPELDETMPMVFTSPRDGWVAVGRMTPNAQGPQPGLYQTVTGGKRWLPRRLPVPPRFGTTDFSSRAYQPVFSGTRGTVLVQFMGETTERANAVATEHTTDGGKTWTVEPPLAAPNESWGDIVPSFVNPDQGWVIGDHGTLFAETSNGGQSWQTIALPRPLKTLLAHHYTVQQLDMVTPRLGWMMLQQSVGQNGAARTTFFKTTDGGRTWTAQRVESH